ncbi:MAG TPA: hypothetical protein P5556_06920 [Candidatus Gastranaerophilales bacterium]|nr:hypothetical protein [Candidatus Gastranaerophilales bacterium]
MIELKGPGASEIKNFIKEKSRIEFCLLSDKTISGMILWHDENVFHLQTDAGNIITLFKNAVMYYSRIN